MTKTRPITFAEFRRFLNGLGFSDKRAEEAWIFHHQTEGLLVFQLYDEGDNLDERDLRSARRFLDLRGVLGAKDFDTFIQEVSAPA